MEYMIELLQQMYLLAAEEGLSRPITDGDIQRMMYAESAQIITTVVDTTHFFLWTTNSVHPLFGKLGIKFEGENYHIINDGQTLRPRRWTKRR